MLSTDKQTDKQTDRQTDRQTNQRYQKHNLLCQGGNKRCWIGPFNPAEVEFQWQCWWCIWPCLISDCRLSWRIQWTDTIYCSLDIYTRNEGRLGNDVIWFRLFHKPSGWPPYDKQLHLCYYTGTMLSCFLLSYLDSYMVISLSLNPPLLLFSLGFVCLLSSNYHCTYLLCELQLCFLVNCLTS